MRKWLSMILILSVLIASIIISSDEYEAVVNEEQMTDALGEYFSQREVEFLGTEESTTWSINTTEHEQAIQAWKEELNIDLRSVDISYSIREIVSNTANEVQLLVYEWVMIDYVCIGHENVVETMGFGTDHLVTFSMDDNELQLSNDIYSEIIGYEQGTEKELEVLQDTLGNVVEEALLSDCQLTMETYAIGTRNYNASNAVSYSNQWCGYNVAGGSSGTMTTSNYNPAFYYYNGADCCNFVSQCLYAGGMAMEDPWYAVLNKGTIPKEDGDYTKSKSAWRYTPDFQTYWTGKGYTVTHITTATQAVIGNPIYWLKRDGYGSNHVMLIVGTNSAGQVLVNAHNNDAYRYPITLSSKKYYTLDVAHNYKTVIAKTATTHARRCTLCSQVKIEAHNFLAEGGGVYMCGVCGYTK